MISINGTVEECHRCGSSDLEIIGYDDYEGTFDIWCNNCNEPTLEDVITIDKIRGGNFIIE